MLLGKLSSEYIDEDDIFYCHGGKTNIVCRVVAWVSVSGLTEDCSYRKIA